MLFITKVVGLLRFLLLGGEGEFGATRRRGERGRV
jgi:hypothetical protein